MSGIPELDRFVYISELGRFPNTFESHSRLPRSGISELNSKVFVSDRSWLMDNPATASEDRSGLMGNPTTASEDRSELTGNPTTPSDIVLSQADTVSFPGNLLLPDRSWCRDNPWFADTDQMSRNEVLLWQLNNSDPVFSDR